MNIHFFDFKYVRILVYVMDRVLDLCDIHLLEFGDGITLPIVIRHDVGVSVAGLVADSR